MPTLANINPAIIALASTLVGILVTDTLGLIRQYLTNKTTETQQLRDLAVKLAIEKWQYEAPKRDELKRRIAADINSGDLSLKINRVSLNDTVREMVTLLQTIPNKTKNTKQK